MRPTRVGDLSPRPTPVTLTAWREGAPRGWPRGDRIAAITLFVAAFAFTVPAGAVSVFGLTGFCDVDCAPSKSAVVAAVAIVASPGVGLAAVMTVWRRRFRWLAISIAPVATWAALIGLNAWI